jgi:virulence-associated protein VagC
MPKTAQIFSDNGHQAIRLPEGMHLSGSELDIRQDQRTGEITLTPRDRPTEQQRRQSWDEFFKLLAEIPQEERDLFVIPRDPAPPKVRDIWQ